MKTKGKIGGYVVRGAACAVFLSVVFVALSSAFQSSNSESQARAFSFAERVAFQRAIEDVYWRHRIWPRNGGENPNPKPSLDAVMSQAQLQKKVEGYLRDSSSLENHWQRPITDEQLQAEMDRMARDTKQPEVLRELFEALGNDPTVIAECLARSILAERLIADLSVQDETRHVESPQTEALGAMSAATTSAKVVYTLPRIADAGDSPCTDQWAGTSTFGAPTARYTHTAVWTGSEMIVWGGLNAGVFNTGGRYNPSTDSWTATSTTNAPAARQVPTAVWTGREMIVWGGADNGAIPLNTGGRYNPGTNTWTATTTVNAPDARVFHTAVWTGSEMIVWGGENGNFDLLNTGARYNPSTDSWTATSTANVPSAREHHTAVWTGSEMIVWGGGSHTDGRYDRSTYSWTATSTTNATNPRYEHTAVWTGSEMIVWGGHGPHQFLNTGGRYCGQSLTVTQPNGGEVWLMGSVHEIKWEGANLKQSDRLIIQYSRTGGATWFRIAQDIPALSFSYSWHVDNYPTTQGRVKILLQGNRSITDQSDANFTVQRMPHLTLLRPNGGESWTVGQYINIHWNRQNPGGNTVDIDYSTDNGTTWIRIATQAEDTGFYLWNVPGPATTQAKARIRFHETPSVTDTSDAVFTIVSP